MKIRSITPLNDGMSAVAADMLWEKVAGFAGYCFNKSHATTYSMISTWAMWVKVRYPAEFYAAAMTVIDKEEKLTGLVLDARSHGIEVRPPDINLSSDRIEISGEKILYAPFQAVKGISTNVAAHIMKVREAHPEPFTSKAEFEGTVAALKLAAKVNKAHREKLDRVGAFAGITPGAVSAIHTERLKDRLELMPGFTVDAVKADRAINDDRLNLLKLISLAEDCRACSKCSLAGSVHPTPRIGKTPKFMVVFDAPNWQEAKKGKLLEGDAAGYLKAALKDAGLSANDGYFTALVRAPKPAGEKMLSNESIIACSEYLKQEIEILKPPVIVAMGSNSIRFFAPGIKGSPAELAGKIIFDPKLDASVVFGLNPAQITFDPSKARLLQNICEKIVELIE